MATSFKILLLVAIVSCLAIIAGVIDELKDDVARSTTAVPSLAQEHQKAEQREAELQQERQKAEALARNLKAARAEVAALDKVRRLRANPEVRLEESLQAPKPREAVTPSAEPPLTSTSPAAAPGPAEPEATGG